MKGQWYARQLGELEKDRYAELSEQQRRIEDREARLRRAENARRMREWTAIRSIA